MSKIDFRNRVAVVTGAGAGLGRDYALQLARRGAKVVVNDLGGARDGMGSSRKAADEVVEEIKAAGGQAIPNYDSVATASGGENIIRKTLESYGRLDVLINNAGILRDGTFVKMEEENWDAVMNVHLKGTYNVTRPAYIYMRQRKYGRIINTGSVAGIMGNFGQANYGAAKMGIIGLTNVLKLEGQRYNIMVNVILPGALTRMTEDIATKQMAERMKVGYVTSAVLYLSSEQCTHTGYYINALAGHYSRSCLVTGTGYQFSKVPDPEEIMAKWDSISGVEDAKYYEDMSKYFGDILAQ